MKSLARRVFPSSSLSIDQNLTRPFDCDVPMGSSGARVWAGSPHGWAFGDDVHWIDLTSFRGFDLEIRDEHGLLAPARATYFPSHIHYEGTARRDMTASASFTFAFDNVSNPLVRPFEPHKRWTCRSSGERQDWYEVDFGLPRGIAGFDLFIFDDAPRGACRPPESIQIQYFDGKSATWTLVEPERVFPKRPRAGENRFRFETVESTRFRFVFHHAGPNYYTGLYGVTALGADPSPSAVPACPFEIQCDKFISSFDILVSIIRVHNPTSQSHIIYVDPVIDSEEIFDSWHFESHSGTVPTEQGDVYCHEPRSISLAFRQYPGLEPIECRFRYAVVDLPPVELEVSRGGQAGDIRHGLFAKPRLDHPSHAAYKAFGHRIGPGQTKFFKAALEPRRAGERATIDSVLIPANDRNFIIKPQEQDTRDPLSRQCANYQSWFDAHIAYFECPDPWLSKLYYHRAYLLRKNMLEPGFGGTRWSAPREGRRRGPWFPNVIPDFLGLVGREDDLLEIDPLVPENALDFFLLDGVRYRGHDVTIVWDQPGADSPDRYGDGHKGLDVYLDGRLAARSPSLSSLCIDLKTGQGERSPTGSSSGGR